MSWILDWMPWWIPWAAAGIALLCTLPWWLPAATAIWRLLPGWLQWLLGGFVLALMAYGAGRNRGRSGEVERERARDARAVSSRAETDRVVGRLPPDKVTEELNRWNRD